jgi:TP901 family phage tail tape measure protein
VATVANLFIRIAASSTEFEKTLKGAEAQFNKTGAKLQSIGGNLTKAISLPLVAGATAAIKFSADFEKAMTKTVTLAGETSASMQQMRVAVLDMSKDVGIGPTQLAEALVAIESTGFTGAAALDILRASAMGSAIGMGEAADVGRAITAVVNAYGESNITAAEAADQLHQTVLVGGADADTLAGELGRVVGVASSLGVSFAEVGAFIATYTKLGLSAAEATTGLSGVLNTILDPSTEARDALEGIGMSAQGLRDQVAEKGLGAALTSLIGKLHGNADATGALFGNVRALSGVMGTAGTQAEVYRENLEKIQNSTGSLGTAFKVWEGTTAATWSKFTAGAQAAAIAIGDELAPAFSRVLQAAMPLLDAVVSMVNWFSQLPQPVQTAALGLTALLAAAGPIAYAIGSLMKAGAGLIGIFRMLPGAITAVSSGWALLANPITLVVAAIGGVLYALKQLTGSWTGAFKILMPPIGFFMEAWQKAGDAISKVMALMPGGTAMPKAPAAPAADTYGTTRNVDAALAMLDTQLDASLSRAKKTREISEEAAKAAKAHAEAIKKMAEGLSGASAIKELNDLVAAWKSLPPSMQQSKPVLDRVLDGYMKLSADLTNVPSQLKPVVAQLNSMAMAAGEFYEEVGKGLTSLDGISQAVNESGGGFNTADLWASFADVLALERPGSRGDNAASIGSIIGAMPDVGKPELSDFIDPQLEKIAKETVDSLRSSFQYFTGSLSGGVAAMLGGVMNILEKGVASGGWMQKLLGGKMGAKIGAGLDIGMSAFGGGYGMGEAWGTGKGALGGAAMGAATGAAMGSVVPVIGTAIGGLIGGIAGLFGGIFGGKKKKKEEAAKMAEVKGQLLDQFGSMEALTAAATRAGVSVTTLFATDNAKVFQAELEKVTGAIEVMQERIASTVGEIDKVMAEGGLIGKELWQSILTDGDAEEIKAKMAEVFDASVQRSAEGFGKIAMNFELLKRPLNEIGVLADAAFAGLLAGGASIPEAIAQMGDGLAHIQELMAKSGEGATGPLAQILNYQAISEAHAGLFELLSGVDDMIVGLGNSGMLTQERFAALGMTITQAFGQLTAQGVAGTTAMEMMQPQLQKLWEAQQTFGLKTDAATQALIDQAVTQGLVGQNMKDVNSQILDVLTAIAKVLGAELPAAFNALGPAAAQAGQAIQTEFGNIRVGVGVDWNIGNMPQPGGPTGGTGSKSPTSSDWGGGILAPNDPRITGGVRPMATGGIVTRPMHALIGEAGPEAVIPLDEWKDSGPSIRIDRVYGTVDKAFVESIAKTVQLGGKPATAWRGVR